MISLQCELQIHPIEYLKPDFHESTVIGYMLCEFFYFVKNPENRHLGTSPKHHFTENSTFAGLKNKNIFASVLLFD